MSVEIFLTTLRQETLNVTEGVAADPFVFRQQFVMMLLIPLIAVSFIHTCHS